MRKRWDSSGNQYVKHLHSYEWRCFFIKTFENLHGQLSILHHRGLTINDYNKAKRYLLTNNYYNLINGYSKYFQNESDKFIKGSTFDEITYLHFYDQQIKQYTFKTILEAENHIKYTTAYYFAEHYKDIPYSYLNINSYHVNKKLKSVKSISVFTKYINTYSHSKQPDNPIKHYVNKYNDVPIWVIIDYLTFGELRHFILNLPDQIKNKIAKSMYSFIADHDIQVNVIFTNEIMDSFLSNLNELRNTCAHDNKLLGYTSRSNVKYYKDLHSIYGITKNDSRRDFFNTFILLQCFTSRIEYRKLHNSILKSFKNLDKKLQSIDINKILSELGFSTNWHKTTSKLLQ